MDTARPAWQAGFHAAHFDAPDRRAWFAAHLAAGSIGGAADRVWPRGPGAPGMPAEPTASLSLEELEDQWTQLAPGESEAAWQQRHGVQYLTPGAARVFDASRRFRAQRAEAPAPADTAPAPPAGPSAAHTARLSLPALRARALAAKRRAEPGTSQASAADDACHPYSRAMYASALGLSTQGGHSAGTAARPSPALRAAAAPL